jgi:hypothetical protein
MHDKPMKKGKTLPPTERRETNKIHTTTSLYLRSGNNWAYSSPNGERGGRATIPSHLLSGLSRSKLTSEAKRNGCIVVGLSFTETTAIITFESYNSTSTFARFEAAATGGTVSVSSADASDKLLTGRFARASVAISIAVAVAIAIVGGTIINSGGILSSSTIVSTSSSTARSRCRGELTSETESDSRIVVRLSVTETTAIITFEGNNGTSTFTRFESTTARAAVGVGGARIGDEGPTGRQAHSTIDEEDSEDSEEFLHCFESIERV